MLCRWAPLPSACASVVGFSESVQEFTSVPATLYHLSCSSPQRAGLIWDAHSAFQRVWWSVLSLGKCLADIQTHSCVYGTSCLSLWYCRASRRSVFPACSWMGLGPAPCGGDVEARCSPAIRCQCSTVQSRDHLRWSLLPQTCSLRTCGAGIQENAV